MKELEIIKLLGFEFSHIEVVDGKYTLDNINENVDIYLTDKYRIAFWSRRKLWSIKNLKTTSTTMIIDFDSIMLAYYKWKTND